MRANAFVRIIIENIGGFLAFAAIIFSGGAVMERVGQQAIAIESVKTEQAKLYHKLDAMQDTIKSIELEQTVQNRRTNQKKS